MLATLDICHFAHNHFAHGILPMQVGTVVLGEAFTGRVKKNITII